MNDTPFPSSKTYDVLKTLRADILTCRLRPGDRLKISHLAEELGVSLSSVREALSTLTAEGLLMSEPQRGFRVTPISVDDLMDISRVRSDIETKCLTSAITHGDIDWETGIVAALHRLNKSPERAEDDPARLNDAYSTAHEAFHEALLVACDSNWLLRLRETLFIHTQRYRNLSIALGPQDRNIRREHEELAEATLARDIDRATFLLAAHLNRTFEIILASMKSLSAETTEAAQ